MNAQQEERIVNAVEVIAISLAHATFNWINVHANGDRANYLLDHIEPLLRWRMERSRR